jgi:hypothetical protein
MAKGIRSSTSIKADWPTNVIGMATRLDQGEGQVTAEVDRRLALDVPPVGLVGDQVDRRLRR